MSKLELFVSGLSSLPNRPRHEARDRDEDERQERRAAQGFSHECEGIFVVFHEETSSAAMPRLAMSFTLILARRKRKIYKESEVFKIIYITYVKSYSVFIITTLADSSSGLELKSREVLKAEMLESRRLRPGERADFFLASPVESRV
jgi:hypothetical protein